jgi:hypothetical protein
MLSQQICKNDAFICLRKLAVGMSFKMATRAIERLDVLDDNLTVGEVHQANIPQPLVGRRNRAQNFTDESCIVDTIKNADDPIAKVIDITEDIMEGFIKSDSTEIPEWLDEEAYLSEDKYLAAEIWAIAPSWLKGVESEQRVEDKLRATDGVELVSKEDAADELGDEYENAYDLETSAVDIIYVDEDDEWYFVQVKSSVGSARKVDVSGNELLNGALYTDTPSSIEHYPKQGDNEYNPPWE